MSNRRNRHTKSRRRRERVEETACCAAEAATCGLTSLTLLSATAAGYARTPRVREGRRATRPLLRAIRSYQREVSAHRPAVCQLEPTCSHYGYVVLRDRGLCGLGDLRRRLRACAEAGRGNRLR